MNNICMCGAEDGYPHDAQCPFPYYGRDTKREYEWLEAYRAIRKAAEATQPIRITGEISGVSGAKS